MLPPGRVLRQIDLGYHSLAADLLFIRANVYYGHHLFTDEQMPWMANFIDILMELDPDFKKTYMWGALVTTHYKRQVSNVPLELIQRAIKILEAGQKRFPNDHRFPMRIAFNYYYELGEADAAIPYFVLAGRLPDAPNWLRKKLVDLYSKKGRTELARQTLEYLIIEEEDPLLSESLQVRLANLLQGDEQPEVVVWREKAINQWKLEYDYIPFDLFLLIRQD